MYNIILYYYNWFCINKRYKYIFNYRKIFNKSFSFIKGKKYYLKIYDNNLTKVNIIIYL